MSQSDNKLLAALPRARLSAPAAAAAHAASAGGDGAASLRANARLFSRHRSLLDHQQDGRRQRDRGRLYRQRRCRRRSCALPSDALTIETGSCRWRTARSSTCPRCCSSASSRATDVFAKSSTRFSHSFLETMIQAVACNRLHTAEAAVLPMAARRARSPGPRPVRVEGSLSRARDGGEELRGRRNHGVARGAGLARHDGASITILDSIGLRRLACRCYDAMKRGYTLERLAAQPRAEAPQRVARVLTMRPGVGRLHIVRLVDARSAQERPRVHPGAGRGNRELDSANAHAPKISRPADGQSRAALPRHPQAIEQPHLTYPPLRHA